MNVSVRDVEVEERSDLTLKLITEVNLINLQLVMHSKS